MSMTRIELISKADADGVIHVEIPVGPGAADVEFRIVAERLSDAPRPARPFLNREEWLAFIERTAGKWQGEFEIPDDPPPQERDLW